MTLTPRQREDLKTELEVLDKAASPILEAMKPLQAAADAVQELRDCTLLRYNLTDDPARCEGCDALILHGDQYHPSKDAGPLCEACAPTWADLREQSLKTFGDADEDEDDVESARLAIKAYDGHLAGGGKRDDKVLYTFDDGSDA